MFIVHCASEHFIKNLNNMYSDSVILILYTCMLSHFLIWVIIYTDDDWDNDEDYDDDDDSHDNNKVINNRSYKL